MLNLKEDAKKVHSQVNISQEIVLQTRIGEVSPTLTSLYPAARGPIIQGILNYWPIEIRGDVKGPKH
jgi:hypothetical protein